MKIKLMQYRINLVCGTLN